MKRYVVGNLQFGLWRESNNTDVSAIIISFRPKSRILHTASIWHVTHTEALSIIDQVFCSGHICRKSQWVKLNVYMWHSFMHAAFDILTDFWTARSPQFHCTTLSHMRPVFHFQHKFHRTTQHQFSLRFQSSGSCYFFIIFLPFIDQQVRILPLFLCTQSHCWGPRVDHRVCINSWTKALLEQQEAETWNSEWFLSLVTLYAHTVKSWTDSPAK